MTTVYFVRHAQSDHTVNDDTTRPLTEKGMRDRLLARDFLRDKGIAAVYSSPYARAVQTVQPLAEALGLEVVPVDGLHERRVRALLPDEDFKVVAQNMWLDHNYSDPGGESLSAVRTRNIAALERLLTAHDGDAIVIGTHGCALSCIISHYDASYGYEQFMAMLNKLPWIVRMDFDGGNFIKWKATELL